MYYNPEQMEKEEFIKAAKNMVKEVEKIINKPSKQISIEEIEKNKKENEKFADSLVKEILKSKNKYYCIHVYDFNKLLLSNKLKNSIELEEKFSNFRKGIVAKLNDANIMISKLMKEGHVYSTNQYPNDCPEHLQKKIV